MKNKGLRGDTMVTITKKELILDGLDCAHCSAKIEHDVNKIDGVNGSMNFMTKTLTLEIDDDIQYDGVLEKVNIIVHKHEPHVKVEEKKLNIITKKSFTLEG